MALLFLSRCGTPVNSGSGPRPLRTTPDRARSCSTTGHDTGRGGADRARSLRRRGDGDPARRRARPQLPPRHDGHPLRAEAARAGHRPERARLPGPRDRHAGTPLLAGRTTKTGEQFARLLSWVDGTPWAEAGPWEPELLRELGRTVARTDRALASVDHPAKRRTHRWNMLEAPPLTASTPSGFVADALRHFHELRPRLERPAVAGDPQRRQRPQRDRLGRPPHDQPDRLRRHRLRAARLRPGRRLRLRDARPARARCARSCRWSPATTRRRRSCRPSWSRSTT